MQTQGRRAFCGHSSLSTHEAVRTFPVNMYTILGLAHVSGDAGPHPDLKFSVHARVHRG